MVQFCSSFAHRHCQFFLLCFVFLGVPFDGVADVLVVAFVVAVVDAVVLLLLLLLLLLLWLVVL